MYEAIGLKPQRKMPLLIDAARKLLVTADPSNPQKVMDDAKWNEKILDLTKISNDDIETIRLNLETILSREISEYGSFFFLDASQIANLDSSIRYFIADFFSKSERLEGKELIPEKLIRRETPLLTITEILDDFLATKVEYMLLPKPGISQFKKDGDSKLSSTSKSGVRYTPLKRDVVISRLLQSTNAILTAESLRLDLLALAKRYTSHLLGMVKAKKEIDQFEKTWLANALTAEFGLPSTSPSADIKMSEDAVAEFAELKNFIKENYLPGPYSKVAGMLATGGLLTPILYVGTYVHSVELLLGKIAPFFKVSHVKFEASESMAWDVSTLLKFMTSSDIAVQTVNIRNKELTIKAVCLGNVSILDDENVIPFFDRLKESFVWRFFSEIEQCLVTIGDEVTPERYYIEKYGLNSICEETSSNKKALSDYKYVDISSISSYLIPIIREIDILVARKRNGKFELLPEKLNIRALLPGGNVIYRPIMSKYFAVNNLDLLTINEDFINVAEGELGLSRDEVFQSQHILSYQWNAYKLRELFGLDQSILSKDKIEAMVKNIFQTK